MKDFCKWLGVSDKTAKVIVWIFIIMSMLIIFNSAFESMGLPYYKLTIENLSKIDYPKIIENIFDWVITLLNFYSLVFLIFPIKDFKNIFKYSILYLILNVLIFNLTNEMILNIFIIVFFLIFSYFYSNKKVKYIGYAAISYIINAVVQYICYLYKVRFIDFAKINSLNEFLTSFDYFIFMFIIILVKEIFIKNKNKKN